MLGLYDNTGTLVVRYLYDAWGVPLGMSGALAESLGEIQPFRYRGYEFDQETGLYYLRSRYYRSEWGRFISADAIVKGNLYGYCNNSPAKKVDADGTIPNPCSEDDEKKMSKLKEAYKRSFGTEYSLLPYNGFDYDWEVYEVTIETDVTYVNTQPIPNGAYDIATIVGAASAVTCIILTAVSGPAAPPVIAMANGISTGIGVGAAGFSVFGLVTHDEIPTRDEYTQFTVIYKRNTLGMFDYNGETVTEIQETITDVYLYIPVGNHSGDFYHLSTEWGMEVP